MVGLLDLSFRTKAFIPPVAGCQLLTPSNWHMSRNFPQDKIYSPSPKDGTQWLVYVGVKRSVPI